MTPVPVEELRRLQEAARVACAQNEQDTGHREAMAEAIHEYTKALVSNADALLSAVERVETLQAENERLAWIVEQVKLQAQGWAQEARTQRSTVHEIYQLVSGSTGEPGTWHGAEPVRQALKGADQ